MSQIQQNTPMYNMQTGTPVYNHANNVQTQPQQQTVSVSSPTTSQVYQYPEASLYNNPNKQPASGVNIYIYNPSAIGGPSSNSTANATYALPAQTAAPVVAQAPAPAPANANASAIANTPISQNADSSSKEQKTKKIVDLTDDYIKTLESYLRSPDASVRSTGIKQIIQRFEEDESRYDDPALTALLNIALQDPDENNRLLAMTPVASGSAHGDQNTIEFLKKLQSSDKLYGQEAVMATNSLVKAVETKVTVPDNSPSGKEESK